VRGGNGETVVACHDLLGQRGMRSSHDEQGNGKMSGKDGVSHARSLHVKLRMAQA
jgi:hypothetical protein